ncbi:transporter substrate-binding domain-containing protein [Azospirillum sp. TSO35-2]|uniref:transporter substrate-binding domain-containing protein n=1 Tax=Azospirillum sp. TSO35-2 TaxID=716796 RepID=UPI000D608D4A|nr:transporter substrate-binding domain-containing protein [Azospirillum sp. TSO35-2]PWC36467.1 amino acid ABC transporter substrate-binding protein [Azospirillum sp. TSO35-2]
MKKILLALVLGALATGAADLAMAKDAKKIRIASEGSFAPWNGMDSSGKLVGFEIDLAWDLCKRMEAECELIAQDWDGMIPSLQQGKIDAIMAGMTITDERKKVIAFAGPYGTEQSTFAVLKSSKLNGAAFGADRLDLADEAGSKAALAKLAELLKGKAVGVQTSTIQVDFLEKHLPDVAVRSYDKIDNAAMDLAAGRVDAIFGDRSPIEAIIRSMGKDSMTLVGPTMTRGVLGEGMGVGLRKTDAELKDRFDKAIADANKDGTIAKLSQQHFGYDVTVR